MRTIFAEQRARSPAEKPAPYRSDLCHPSPTGCFRAFFVSSGNGFQTCNFS
jgi:hypothetical protein